MKELNDIQELDLRLPNGEPFEIPVQGSLGLLALGDIGLMAWRQKKLQFIKAQQGSKNNNTEK